MDFYTDGSRIGLNSGNPCIGWSAICNYKVIVAKHRVGGSNINAEIFAIRDLLKSLTSYNKTLILDEECINIYTDSKTSLQIIDIAKDNKSMDNENYDAAYSILEYIEKIENMGKSLSFHHIRGHQGILGNTFADYVATSEAEKAKLEIGV